MAYAHLQQAPLTQANAYRLQSNVKMFFLRKMNVATGQPQRIRIKYMNIHLIASQPSMNGVRRQRRQHIESNENTNV